MHREAERVRASNQRFYEALSSQSLLVMEQVWSHSPYVSCVHLGGELLQCWEPIRDSWRTMFTQALAMTVEPQSVRINVLGLTAIVTCREKITSFTLEGSRLGTAEATNVFEKKDGNWMLIHHHASPVAHRERPEGGE